jgi:hypothetical protein
MRDQVDLEMEEAKARSDEAQREKDMQSAALKRGFKRALKYVGIQAEGAEKMIEDELKTLIEWENSKYPHKGALRVKDAVEPEYVSPAEAEFAESLLKSELAELPSISDESVWHVENKINLDSMIQ